MIGSQLINRYEIVAELGKGGMGVVYLAKDPVLDRRVAVKMLPAGYMSKDTEDRLRREARLVARMDHPSITPVFDLGTHQGSLFVVMPVLRGETLRHLIDVGRLSLGDVLTIATQVADALDYSHAKGVIHRDIKPENVMVGRERGQLRARVMDFGLARDPLAHRSITQSGGIIGTLTYMSPEQIQAKPIDHRSDLYSLGAVLYECLSGHAPFSGPVHQLIVDIARDTPIPLSARIEVDPELQTLVERCLSKDPALRPRIGREIVQVLERCAARMEESQLTRAVAAPDRSAPRRWSSSAPLIGRKSEIKLIERCLTATREGERQMIIFEGDMGMGKSRLLEEAGRLADGRGIRCLRGRIADRQNAPVFQAFFECLQEYYRTKELSGRTSGMADFSDLAADLLTHVPIFREIDELRVHLNDTPPVALPKPGESFVFELLARMVSRIAGGHPLVLLFENLHLGDGTVEALDYVMNRLRPTPTLFVGTLRPTEVERGHPVQALLRGLASDPKVFRVPIGPLTHDDLAELMRSQLAEGDVTNELVQHLLDTSEGNPLFALELVKSLRDSDEIHLDASGNWVLDHPSSLSSSNLPTTVKEVVEKQLEGLDPSVLKILQIAAIIGRSFDFEDLEMMLEGHQDSELENVIDDLVEQGILTEDRRSRSDRLAFTSGLVRDVLYLQIPRRKRRRSHRRLARWLEKRHHGRLERVQAELVHHCAEGNLGAEAVRYGLDLAEREVFSHRYEEAARAAATALEFVDDDEIEDPSLVRGRLLLLLAKAERSLGRFERALDHGNEALEVLETRDTEAAAVALHLLAETAWQARRIETARRWVDRGVEAARAAQSEGVLRDLLVLGATLANLRGEHERARAHIEEAEVVRTQIEESVDNEINPLLSSGLFGSESGVIENPLKRSWTGGELRIAFPGRLDTLDPVAATLSEGVEIIPHVFETLTRMEDGAITTPWLAERFDTEDAGKTFEIILREARFHDGSPLTCADVKSSFERMLSLPRPETHYLFLPISGAQDLRNGKTDQLKGIRIVSDRKMVIELESPMPLFPSLASHPLTAVLPEGIEVLNASWRAGCVGTGPFRVLRFTPGERILLERNPDYWRPGFPCAERWTCKFGVPPLRHLEEFRAGKLSLASDLRPSDAEALRRDPKLAAGYRETPRLATYFLAFNSVQGALADLEARRDFARALNIGPAVAEAGRLALPARGLIPPGLLGAGRDALRYPRGDAPQSRLRLRAVLHPAFGGQYSAFWQQIRQAAEHANAEIDAIVLEPHLILDRAREGAADLVAFRWVADYPDTEGFVGNLLHSNEGSLAGICEHPTIDQLIERGRQETDPGLRHVIYREIEEILIEEALILPLFHEQIYRFCHSSLRGFRFGTSTPEVHYDELFLDR